MAIREIRDEDDDILRKISKPVAEITPRIITLLDDMLETMNAADGVGIAAPQVGILRRVVIVNLGEQVYEMINPEIVESNGTQRKLEGCLSVPGMRGYVIRPLNVTVKYMDREFNEQLLEASEMLAVAVCHEIDHLDGILYIDKLDGEDDTEFDEDEDDEFEDDLIVEEIMDGIIDSSNEKLFEKEFE